MTHIVARRLISYGAFLFVIALVAVSYDPRAGEFGFYSPAKTALISGGICGSLSILWGVLLGRGLRWPLSAAIASTLLFLTAFTWRATAGWMTVAAGETHKWFAATLISLMWIASAALVVFLFRARASSSRPIDARESLRGSSATR
jgi:uncharacterized membrane protein (UPF0136 family)